MEKRVARDKATDHLLSANESMDAKDEEKVTQLVVQQVKEEVQDVIGTPFYDAGKQLKLSVESTDGKNAPAENDSDDEFAVRFSAAQLKAKVAQAKHEVKIAADVELLALKKELIERHCEVADCERERDKVVVQLEAVQMRLDAVLQEHKQTICGIRESLQLEELLAKLDVEKAARQKLQDSFEMQQRALALAQERVEKLDMQVASYQKTETVLAQSIAHLQHRFSSKDQQRAASVEQIQRELIERHEAELAELREELAMARGTEKMAQEQMQELQKEVKALRDNAQRVRKSEENAMFHEHELQTKIAQLEIEKAELQSKADQIQKADAQLRSQLHAQSKEIAVLQQEKKELQRDNKELGEIASDLMQMAERQHSENVNRGISPAQPTSLSTPGSSHEEDGIFLQKRKKRLRLSLG